MVIVVAACSRAPEILYPPVTGHQATPFSDPPEPCQLTYLTEYVENVAAGSTLRGTVVDTADRPAIGAMVFVTSRALVGGQQTMTDEEGRYDLGVLPPGDYAMTIYYESRKAHHRLEIRRGVEAIDHARMLDHSCEPSQCLETCKPEVSQLRRDARTR